MPNTIAENLQRLVDARTDIASSIITKEGTVNTGDGFEEFPEDILTIPSGGGGGTTDYNQLSNKPSINGVTLSGNKTSADLGIVENVQADWDETDSTAPSYIQNKPNIPSGVVVDTAYDGTSENAQAGTAVAQAVSTKVDKVTGKGLSTNDFTNADKDKLDDVESGAQVNVQADWNQNDSSADDFIKNKPTIPEGIVVDQIYKPTSINAQSGVAVAEAVSTKVDKVTGKGLSQNDYTDADKAKLSSIESGAEENVQADWNQTDATADDFIKNKPHIPSGVVVDQTYSPTSTNAQAGVAVAEAISDKVDKVNGKGLSTNDFTDADKTKLDNIESGAEANVQSDWNQNDSTADDFIKNKPTITTVNDAVLEIQTNGAKIGEFTANASTDSVVNITVPVNAVDVNALPASTKYGASLSLSIDTSTYVVTATLSDQDGETLGAPQTIDLPLESVVVNGEYDDAAQKIILTLNNGNTVEFSVADLVSGLQAEITSTNKLSADLVDDATSTNKFVTAAEKTVWNAKSDFSGSYNDLTDVPEFATVATTGSYNDLTDKPVIPPGVAVDQTFDPTSQNAQSGTAVSEAIADKVDKVNGKGLSTNDFTDNDKTKLDGVESGAQANVQADWNQTDTSADDYIKNKPTIPSGVVVDQTYDETSTNAQAGVAVAEAIADKVDKVTGKGLSTEDFTTAEKTKLSTIESDAQANVQSDWNQNDSTADDFIKNKPTIPAAQVNSDWDAVSGVAQILNKPTLSTVATTGSYNDLSNKPTIPTVNNATLEIQKNSVKVGDFSADASSDVTVNITVPIDAADVNALPDTTKYAASIEVSINSTTYVMTTTLKDQDGNTLGTAQVVDLPLETMVVGGSYDDTTHKIILTLNNGTTVDFSVADLVSGLQSEITSTNKLDADLVDDSTSTNKFVTAADKTAWNAKSDFSGSYNDLTDKPMIPAEQVNSDWNSASGVSEILNKPTLSTVATSGSYDDLSNKPTIPTVDQTYDSTSTNPQSGAAISEAIADKVDKVTGKGLSTNDYTNADKSKLDNIESGAQANVQSDWNQSDSSADDFIKNKPTISAVNDATLTIQKNGTAVGTFSANAATAATINITVPTGAADINALPATTKYGASIDVSIDSSTYVMTTTLKDQDGNTLGMPQTVDLPLETMVVGGSYDDATHKIILTLNNGTTVEFSVADLVAGLQSEITSTNKLDADLVDDTTSTHKFVTSADKAAWNAKSDFSGSYNDLTDKPTIPPVVVVDQTYSASSTNAQSGTAVAQAIASVPTAANKVDRDGDTGLSGTFAPSSDNGATLGTSTSRFGSVYGYRADYVYYTNNEITDAPSGMGGNFLLAPQSSVENAVKLDISDCFKFNIRDTPSRANMNIGSTTRYGGMWLSDGQGGGVTIYTDTEGSGIGNNYSVYLPHVTTYSGEHNVLALKSDIPTVTDASTTTKGIVQLSDSVSTTSSTTAATSTAVKTLNDNKVDRAGDASLSGTFAPTTDNGATLGTSSKRFDTVYGETADFEYYELSDYVPPSGQYYDGCIVAENYHQAGLLYKPSGLNVSEHYVEGIATDLTTFLYIGSGPTLNGDGRIIIGDGHGHSIDLRSGSNSSTGDIAINWPAKSGTLACTSDIPTVNDASTTTKGIVQLSDSVSTTSSTTAATSTAVKTVNDSVANKVDKTGNNMLSGLFEPQSNNGAKLGSSSYKFSDVYTSKINGNTMPSGSGTIALTSDIPSVPTYYAGTGLTKSGNTFSVEGPETVTISVNGSYVSLDSQSVYKDPGTGWVYGTWRCTVTKAFSTSANTAIVAFPTGARLTTGQVPVQCYSTSKKTHQFYIAWLNVNIVRVFSSGVASSLLPAVGDVLVFSVGFFNKEGI